MSKDPVGPWTKMLLAAVSTAIGWVTYKSVNKRTEATSLCIGENADLCPYSKVTALFLSETLHELSAMRTRIK